MDKTKFINKKNIGYVNYLVNNTLGLTDLTKDDKKFIITTLVKNMEYVYGKLNHNKINKRNFKGAEEQFNQLTYKRTIKQLQQNLAESEEQYEQEKSSQNIQQVKMQRDQINNTQSMNYMDHPTMMGNNSIPNMEEVRMSRDMVTNNNAQIKYLDHPEMNLKTRSNDFHSNFEDTYNVNNSFDHDRLLKTRDGPQYVDRQMAVNSRHGLDERSSNMSANDRFNELQQARETEIRQRQVRPPTPEFIKNNREKERQTSQPYQEETKNLTQQQQNHENNFGLEGVGNDDNLGSLDNYGASLAPKNVSIDESISVEDRLKQMEAERGNMTMPPAMNDKTYNRNMSMSNRVTTTDTTTQLEYERQSQREKWENENKNFNQKQFSNNRGVSQSLSTNKTITINTDVQKPIPQKQLNYSQNNNNYDEMFNSKISEVKDEFYNSLNPLIQNTNALQNEIQYLKQQSSSTDYSKQFDLLNKNFQLLSNKTSQIKEVQSKELEALSTQFSNFYTEINNRIERLSNNSKIKEKKYLLDEDNYNKNNNEFILDLESDLQNGKVKLLDFEINDQMNIIDLHNNRLYFKIQHSESSNTKDEEEDQEIEINSIVIEPGNYSLDELISSLNEKLEKFNLQFEIKSNYLSIKLKDDPDVKSFSIYNLDNSILPFIGFKLKKYESAISYTGENHPKLEKPKIFVIYLIDNENTLTQIAKYSLKSNTIFMEEYIYNNLDKLRFKIKLENGYTLSLNNICNLELSITYMQSDTFLDENSDSTYSFVN